MDVQLAPPGRANHAPGDARLLWRMWRVIPDARGTPVLTGLLGFPWKERVLEARCTAIDSTNGRYVGRYHRAVPALGCTCGIYAARNELEPQGLPCPPRGEPVVQGFVQLTGRLIEGSDSIRAERAEIVGPLVVRPGRPPWSRRSAEPSAIQTGRDHYRVRWRSKPSGVTSTVFQDLAGELAARYQCAVIAGRT